MVPLKNNVSNELTAELSSPKRLRCRACCCRKPPWLPSFDWALLEEPVLAAGPVLALDCCLFLNRLDELGLLDPKSPPNPPEDPSSSFGQGISMMRFKDLKIFVILNFYFFPFFISMLGHCF